MVVPLQLEEKRLRLGVVQQAVAGIKAEPQQLFGIIRGVGQQVRVAFFVQNGTDVQDPPAPCTAGAVTQPVIDGGGNKFPSDLNPANAVNCSSVMRFPEKEPSSSTPNKR